MSSGASRYIMLKPMRALTIQPPSSIFARLVFFELRKQRRFFLSTCIVICAGLALSVIVNYGMQSTGLLEAILGAAAFLTGSLPIVAALIGGSAAAALRRDPDKSAEELLPLAPYSRPFASYLASLAYTLLIFLASLQWLGIARLGDLEWFAYLTPLLLRSAGYGTCLLLLIKVHTLAFLFSYWLALPVLGGGLAIILAALDFFILNSAARLMASYYGYYFPAGSMSVFFSRLNFKLIMELASLVWILFVVSRKLETGSRVKLARTFLFVGIILLALVWSYVDYRFAVAGFKKAFGDFYS